MKKLFSLLIFFIAFSINAQIITNVDKLRIRDVEQGLESDKILVIDANNVVRWIDSVDSILEDYYTISEVDAFVSNLEAELLERYTKDEVDALLNGVELRLDDYYTKTEINGLLSNYYNIVEIDALLDTKQDLLSQTDNEAIKNKINPVRINLGIGQKVAINNVNTNILEDAEGSQYFSVTDRKKGASYAGKIIGYANASTLSKLRFEFDLTQSASYSNIIFESAEFEGVEQPFTLDYAIDFLEDNTFSISGSLQVGGKYINIPEMLGQSPPTGVREMRVQVRLSNSGDSGYVTKNLLELKDYKNDMVNMLIFGGQRKSIQVVTHNGMPYEVIWADGSSEVVASGGIANNVGGLSDVVDFEDRDNVKEIVIKEGFDFNISDFAYLDFLERLEVEPLKTNVSGDIANAPTSLTYLQISGSNTLTGDIASAPTGLTYLRISGSNTLTGDIANAPTSLTDLLIYGSNTLTGDIANAPTSLTYLQISGSNTLTGDIANAPTSLTYLNIQGSNTLTGDIANAPTGLTYLRIQGSNTFSGDIANAPTGLTYLYISGSNTLTGDIANTPTGLTYLNISGSNTLTGDISNAPAGLATLTISGSNTFSGDIANAPTGLTYLNIQGSNTLTGDIANAPTGLTYLNITGSNTLTGDIANAPTGLTYLRIQGSNTLTYSTRTWSNNQRLLLLRATNFDAQMLDQLLIDLSVASWTGERSADLRIGNNVQRTSASDSAVLLLQSKGVTVLTN